ncbi:delta-1-pyrroline-5-carboxylate dehydrogenase [Bacillus freudenreichii]|nr:delta-1-pyrroline-5-carboxylate dehydrogenase [Bacillus freudenreichii]
MTVASFKNEPSIDWTLSENKAVLDQELRRVHEQFSTHYPLFISGKEILTENKLVSLNPSDHKEVVGYVSQASQEHVDMAMEAATDAYGQWSQYTFRERALYLLKTAKIFRRRKAELMAWLIYESGKNAAEADGEVNEAIDFLEMYARQAMELEQEADLIPMPGIENRMVYLPLGVGVIIPPWNFPLAILTGLTVSALVTGNTVLIKPSSATPVTAVKFIEMLKEAGIPDGVINYVPGPSSLIGDYMVSHRDVNFISFTGSKEAGLHIDEVAHRRIDGQRWIKRMVGEMGGKGGIVVDETADLDLAADGIVTSAFGYQGQKCSAGSRAIIHEKVYDDLVEKIVERTKGLTFGPSIENTFIGPVIDEKAFDKITEFIELGKNEANLIYGGHSDKSEGYYIEPTVFKDAGPDSVIMQEEIFGPVLAMCKVSDFEEGISVYNNTEYGLTGAFYSKDRARLEHAAKHMVCGNLFLNGKCTGAVVGVQPFGGYYMSGTGSKIGTKEFLLNFVQPKTISENL